MSKLRMPLFLAALLAIAASLYLLLSTPDYGDTNADGLNLGKTAYQQGDFDEAAKWFRLAAKKGDKQAQFLFAMLHRDGKGLDRNDEQAVRWLKLAAKQNHAEAQYQLGTMLEHGRGVDTASAFSALGWYRKAAKAGHAGAQLRMAVMLAEGRGSQRNESDALDWAVKARISKHPDAGAYLQQLLNRITAKASSGDPAAQFILARMYQRGHGLNSDMQQAEQWLRQSASSGKAEAQFHLAELLSQKPQQLHEAADWYLKAARQGNLPAAAKIGTLYATGQGIKQNNSEAIAWLGKAAESDLSLAQCN
ncbi:MAG: tetratricopeptide repeat protein, partial [Mariprofundus sp.]